MFFFFKLQIYCISCSSLLSLWSQAFSPALSPLRPLHWTPGTGQLPDLVRCRGNVDLPGSEGSTFLWVPGPRHPRPSVPLLALLQVLFCHWLQFLIIKQIKLKGSGCHGCEPLFFLPGLRSRTPSASSSVFEGPEVRVGERVLVVGQRTGVVQFYGTTSFAPGKCSQIILY